MGAGDGERSAAVGGRRSPAVRSHCRSRRWAGQARQPPADHCNTGGLATAGVGTAIGVLLRAHRQGKVQQVWVDETRPLLQGGRLTARELGELGIPYRLICDAMAASLMAQGRRCGVGRRGSHRRQR